MRWDRPHRRVFRIALGAVAGLPYSRVRRARWSALSTVAAALKKQRMADNMKDNPDAHCLPMGNMQLYTRFTRVNYGKLEIEVTVDDPKAYTRPWTVTMNEIMLDTELIEFICLENEQSTKHFR